MLDAEQQSDKSINADFMADYDNAGVSDRNNATKSVVRKGGQKKSQYGNDDFIIDLSIPLEKFNHHDIQAYSAESRTSKKIKYLAWVGHHQNRMRFSELKSLIYEKNPNMIALQGYDVIDWVDDQRRQVCFAELPKKVKFIPNLHKSFDVFTEERVISWAIMPFYNLYTSMSQYQTLHGHISLDNIYWDETGKTPFIFGPGHLTPAAELLDINYLTINAAMCHPLGRDDVNLSLDLYSLAVLVIGLLQGSSPFHNLSKEEVLSRKIEEGSYSYFTSNKRFSVQMTEFFKGCLNDNPELRWGLSEFSDWVNSRRLTPLQNFVTHKAKDKIKFKDKSYANLPELTHALHTHWRDGIEFILSGPFLKWFRKNYNGTAQYESVRDILIEKKIVGDSESLFAKTLAALTPELPIRFRKISSNIYTLNILAGYYITDQEFLVDYRAMIKSGIVGFWFSKQSVNFQKDTNILKQYNYTSDLFMRTALGISAPRVAYDSNPSLPCKSQLFYNDCISIPEQILPGLDRACAHGHITVDENLFDDHLVSFLFSRMSEAIHPVLQPLLVDDENYQIENPQIQAKTLAVLQTMHHPDQKFPYLGRLVAEKLKKTLKSLYYIPRQKMIAEKLNKLGDGGVLINIANLMDDKGLIVKDSNEFIEAYYRYRANIKESNYIYTKITDVRRSSYFVSGEVSVVIGSIFAASATALIVFLYFI